MTAIFQGSETSGAIVTIYTHGRDRTTMLNPNNRSGNSEPSLSPVGDQDAIGDVDVAAAAAAATGSQGLDGAAYLNTGPQVINLDSRAAGVSDDELRLLSVQTTKTINGNPGTFTFAFKSRNGKLWADIIADDDWVDISFTRSTTRDSGIAGNKVFHVMRGLIDTITRQHVVGQGGATEDVYIVSGRDFTKIYVQTPVWFDRFVDKDYIGAAATRIIEAHEALLGAPDKTVGAFLNGFLSTQELYGRSSWTLPPSMGVTKSEAFTLSAMIFGQAPDAVPQIELPPGVTPSGQQLSAATGPQRIVLSGSPPDATVDAFSDQVLYFTDDFEGEPTRAGAINPGSFSPGSQNVWEIATNFSDPALCELYCELLVSDDGGKTYRYPRDDEETVPPPRPGYNPLGGKQAKVTRMAVIMRDRPFPSILQLKGLSTGEYVPYYLDNVSSLVVSKTKNKQPLPILGSSDRSDFPPFARITTYGIRPGETQQLNVSKDGRLRKNAFFASPSLFQKLVEMTPELQVPLLQRESVSQHGLRRMDVVTNYVGLKNNIIDAFDMATNYRQIIRDHYCLSHLFYNGRCSLAVGRPDIRVGSNVILTGEQGTKSPPYQGALANGFHFYVEGVSHTWALERGTQTNLQVTRGYEGNLQNYTAALRAEVAKYDDGDDAIYDGTAVSDIELYGTLSGPDGKLQPVVPSVPSGGE